MKIPQALRLSLRELFLLVALVATGLGWYIDHERVRDLHETLDLVDTSSPFNPPDVSSRCTSFILHRGHKYRLEISPDDVQ